MTPSTYCKGHQGVRATPVQCCIRCLRRLDPPAGQKVLWLHHPRVSYVDGVWTCKDAHYSDSAADRNCVARPSSARTSSARTA